MENSAQKAGFAIAAMIVVIVAAGVGVDWWDAYHLRKEINGAGITTPGDGVSADQKLKEENERLKVDYQILKLEYDRLKKQLEAMEKKSPVQLELEPSRTEPERVKTESTPAPEDGSTSGVGD